MMTSMTTVTLPQETLDTLVEHYLTSWEFLDYMDKLMIKTFILDNINIFDLSYLMAAYPALITDWDSVTK